MADDDFGAGGSALDRWYARSPAEIDDERRAAEQAGRDAYAEAIRTGQDVQARTPGELVAVGRSRLAQQDGQSAPSMAPAPQDCGSAHSTLMQGDAFVRAAANKATFGLADHLAAAGDAVAGGGDLGQIWRQYQANLHGQMDRDAYDERNRSSAHQLGDRAGEVLAYVGGSKLGAGAAGLLSSRAKGALGEGLSLLKTSSRLDWPNAVQVKESVPGGRTVIDHTTLRGQYVESKFGPHARLTPRQLEAKQKFGDAYRVDRWGPQHIGQTTGAAAGAGSILTDDPNQP